MSKGVHYTKLSLDSFFNQHYPLFFDFDLESHLKAVITGCDYDLCANQGYNKELKEICHNACNMVSCTNEIALSSTVRLETAAP
jgi:hypothetical protein